METQDSIDIVKLQRVALGLVCNDLQRSRFSLDWTDLDVFRSTTHPSHSFPGQQELPALRPSSPTIPITTLLVVLMVVHHRLP